MSADKARACQQHRVLDEAARGRRQRKFLEQLEANNFQNDPHADLKISKKLPRFDSVLDESSPAAGRRARRTKQDLLNKPRYRKNFQALLDEENLYRDTELNYKTASAAATHRPQRHFCSVCGFCSNYTCCTCGMRYCSVKCLDTHRDTRCLKWTV